MAEPFLSEIRIMSFLFAPKGWALCNGQVMPINQSQALFALLGTTYGGNGQTNFALPDLRTRTPIHSGNGHTLGEKGGEQAHTLSGVELPSHNHFVKASSNPATTNTPDPEKVLAQSTASQLYGPADANLTPMAPNAIGFVGGSQPHQNMQPYLTLSFCIALTGIFPNQN